MKYPRLLASALGLGLIAVTSSHATPTVQRAAAADPGAALTYEVTVTNLTRGQVISPVLAATHSRAAALYQLGAPASDELALLAEDGDNSALGLALGASPEVFDVQSGAAPIPPGASETITVQARGSHNVLSLAGMLVNTNDVFAGLDSFPLPRNGEVRTFAAGLDAGSEFNSESCSFIPGPACNGLGAGERDPAGAEGYVYISNGLHGIGDLETELYDWRDAVALVTVRRVTGR